MAGSLCAYRLAGLLLALGSSAGLGCGDAAPSDADAGARNARGADASITQPRPPEFRLSDLNPSSSTYQSAVSPRDVLQKVSGWYFTRAS